MKKISVSFLLSLLLVSICVSSQEEPALRKLAAFRQGLIPLQVDSQDEIIIDNSPLQNSPNILTRSKEFNRLCAEMIRPLNQDLFVELCEQIAKFRAKHELALQGNRLLSDDFKQHHSKKNIFNEQIVAELHRLAESHNWSKQAIPQEVTHAVNPLDDIGQGSQSETFSSRASSIIDTFSDPD